MTAIAVPGFEGFLGKENKYSNNFFVFVHDFNRDQWNDILVIGFPGQDTSWFENPKGKDGHWVAAQDLRSDRQRVADLCRPDW